MKKVILVGFCYVDTNQISSELRKLFKVDVKSFTKSDEAQNFANNEEIDLIFVNRILTGDKKQGLELIKHLKETKIEIPTIMLTHNENKQREAVDNGAVAAFDIDLLIDYISPSKKEKREKVLEVLKKYLE